MIVYAPFTGDHGKTRLATEEEQSKIRNTKYISVDFDFLCAYNNFMGCNNPVIPAPYCKPSSRPPS